MKFIIWLRDPENPTPGYEVGGNGNWVEQGDGPLTEKQAARIAKEIRREGFGVKVKVLPEGVDP